MAHAKKSIITVGLVNIPVRLEVAVDKEASDTHAVCTGTSEAPHAPARVKSHVDCTECGASHSSVWGYPQRGTERDGKLIVLTAEEIKEAAGAPITTMQLAFHSREKVYGATVAGDSVQNMVPDKGGERGYRALRDALAANPHLVAVTVWAPSTKNALWVLEVVDQRVVVSKRAWPEDVRPAPAIPPAEVSDAEQTMFSQLLESTVTDFDLGLYRDAAREGMSRLLDAHADSAVTAPAASPAVTSSGDMFAALQASLAAAQPAKPKTVRTPRKAPAKKVAAKKAPAKRATRTTKKAAAPLSEIA